MSKKKKISLWLIAGLSFILILLITLALLSNLIINQEKILAKIQSEISEVIPGEVEFQRIGLSFFFRPHVVIHQIKFNIPAKATGNFQSLAVYPAILPLFTGKVRIVKLIVEAPNIQIRLPNSFDKKTSVALDSFNDIQNKVISSVGAASSLGPGIVIQLKKGRLKLFEGNTSAFWFKDIQANIELPSGRLLFYLSCKSSLWESISIDGWLDPSDLKSSGHLHLKKIRPQRLSEYLMPRVPWRVIDARANLNLHFKSDGPNHLQAAINGAIPLLRLSHQKETLTIKANSIRGGIELDHKKTVFSLRELNIAWPQAHLAGNLTFDVDEPQASLRLEGRQIDIESARTVALALAGDVRTVQKIFERIKGGRVPLVTFETQGKSFSDFKDAKKIVIRGRMVDGKIYIPKADLNLEEVQGDAVISQVTLEGKNLVARHGNAWGRDGTLKVGLKGKNAPMHLDIGVTADVAQIPPVLKRLVKNRSFLDELERIDNLKGKATGRLSLGGSTKSITPRIDVSEFELSANYARIPYPLTLKGVRFSYKGKQVNVGNLTGGLGRTSFSDLSAGVNWEIEPELTVASGQYQILLEEVFPWITSFESFPVHPVNIKTIDGVVAISSLSIKGPLLNPARWQIASTGEIKNIAINTTLLPAPIQVTKAEFTELQNTNAQKISFADAQIIMLDGSLTVSGGLDDYLKGLNEIDFTVHGRMGPQATRWAANLVQLPPEVHPRSPLSISSARLIWQKNGKTNFSGDLIVPDGTTVNLDVTQHPDALIITTLQIRDQDSRASIQLDFKNEECLLGFNGNLTHSTVNNLLERYSFVSGGITGDFHARIALDQPTRSTAHGALTGQNIVLPPKLNVPMQISSVSLLASNENLKIESAALTWDGIPMALDGNLQFSEEEFRFDSEISTSGMNWDNIKKIVEMVKRNKSGEGKKELLDLPIHGIIRLKSESVSYKKHTWSPVYADILFGPKEISIQVNEAKLCNISTPGVLKVSSQNLQVDFKPSSRYEGLDTTLSCLFKNNLQIEGRFELGGYITGQAPPQDLTDALRGKFKFVAKDGRIYRSLVLARILAFLNVTEFVSGDLADLEQKGFGYKKIKFKTKIKKGRLQFKEILMDGNTLTITGRGHIDLNDSALDFKLLVAPLKTVDRLVEKVPLVGDILADIISIPLSVKGDLSDPKVVPLDPAAVGSELLDLTKRTLRLPFKIIQPVFPGNRNKEKEK
jgi:hypothetical protein